MPNFSPEVELAIRSAAQRYGVPEARLRAFAQIESSGDPRNQTGKHMGLFQLTQDEFRRHGSGNIFDPIANANAAAAKLKAEGQDFTNRTGREPTDGELYMIHQQGRGGSAAHAANPNAPAWQNMAATAEGQQKGAGWAQQAIWNNLPDAVKKQFGSVENVTSKQFTDFWNTKVASAAGTAPATPAAAPPSTGFAPKNLILHDYGGNPQNQDGMHNPYHALVFPDGAIRYRNPDDPYGAPAPHVYQRNGDSIGLSYAGQVGAKPTPEAMATLQQEASRIRSMYPDVRMQGHGEAYSHDHGFSKDGREMQEASWRSDINATRAASMSPNDLAPEAPTAPAPLPAATGGTAVAGYSASAPGGYGDLTGENAMMRAWAQQFDESENAQKTAQHKADAARSHADAYVGEAKGYAPGIKPANPPRIDIKQLLTAMKARGVDARSGGIPGLGTDEQRLLGTGRG